MDYLSSVSYIGIGGAGGNMVNRMAKALFFAPTDEKSLLKEWKNHRSANLTTYLDNILIIDREETFSGQDRTINHGLLLKKGVNETLEIRDFISKVSMDTIVFIIGLGGTHSFDHLTAAINAAKYFDKRVIVLCTEPFNFEKPSVHTLAQEAKAELNKRTDIEACFFQNEEIMRVLDKRTSFPDAIKMSDAFLFTAGDILVNKTDTDNTQYDIEVKVVNTYMECLGCSFHYNNPSDPDHIYAAYMKPVLE